MFAVESWRDRENRFLAKSHDPTVPEILGLAFDKKHSPRADEQESAKDVEDEVESIDQLDADPNHDPTHDERADDSPDQSAMLRHSRNFEVLKNDDKNENVVDAQRVLDHVTGEKLESFFWPADFPNHEIEQEREADPNKRAIRRRPHAQLPPAMLELNQIESERDDNPGVKREPKQNACV